MINTDKKVAEVQKSESTGLIFLAKGLDKPKEKKKNKKKKGQ